MGLWGRACRFVCAGFAGSTWGRAPPGAATAPAAAPCLLLPKYRGHSVQPQAVVSPRWHGDPRPPGTCSCRALLHLLGVFGVTSHGDAVGLWHVAVPPWCSWCHLGAGGATPAPSSCPLLVPRGLMRMLREVFAFLNPILQPQACWLCTPGCLSKLFSASASHISWL